MRRSPWEQSDTLGTEPAQMQGLREAGLTTVLPTARVTVALYHHGTGDLAPRLKPAPAWLPSRLVVQGNTTLPKPRAGSSTHHWNRSPGCWGSTCGPECLCVGGCRKEKFSGRRMGAAEIWLAVKPISKSW